MNLSALASAEVAAAVTMTFVASLTAPTVGAEPVNVTATVLRIVDGDTIDVVDDVRGRLRGRLLGIDTPERRNLAIPSVVGAPKLRNSPKRRWQVNVWHC